MTDEVPIRYPEIEVTLIGEDGNVVILIGKVREAIKESRGTAAANAFTDEAFKANSYDAVLALIQHWVTVT